MLGHLTLRDEKDSKLKGFMSKEKKKGVNLESLVQVLSFGFDTHILYYGSHF